MPDQSHAHRCDLVERICRAVTDNDPLALEILLLVLEAVADEPMLARLEAALNGARGPRSRRRPPSPGRRPRARSVHKRCGARLRPPGAQDGFRSRPNRTS